MNKKIFGISGYMGAGKSFAGLYFKSLGAYFIDADEVVDGLYAKGEPAYLKIVNYFGDRFLRKDGSINRAKIAKFVFDDANKVRILNDLIHPFVMREIESRVNLAEVSVVFIEATYFLPRQLGSIVEKILWIDCEKAILIKRAEHFGNKLFPKILNFQEKPLKIDAIVENNDGKARFESDLKKVWDKWVL